MIPFDQVVDALEDLNDFEYDDIAKEVLGLKEKSRTPAPQIIRTPAELEALDPMTVVYTPKRDNPVFVGDFVADIHYDPHYADDLPAVKVAEGTHLRACREALEGETT